MSDDVLKAAEDCLRSGDQAERDDPPADWMEVMERLRAALDETLGVLGDWLSDDYYDKDLKERALALVKRFASEKESAT